MALPARRPTAHGVKTRSVRSVALFETDAALVTELIPSWHGARDENVDSQEGSLPEITVAAAGGAVPGTLPRSGGARNLQQLRQVLREVGGRKVQQEALVEQQEGVPGQPRQRKARSSACDTATLCAQLHHSQVEVVQVHEVDVQERLVADATAARERHKRDRVLEELRSSRIQHHQLMADYGCANILDFIQFFNPSGEAQTFRVVVRPPNTRRQAVLARTTGPVLQLRSTAWQTWSSRSTPHP